MQLKKMSTNPWSDEMQVGTRNLQGSAYLKSIARKENQLAMGLAKKIWQAGSIMRRRYITKKDMIWNTSTTKQKPVHPSKIILTDYEVDRHWAATKHRSIKILICIKYPKLNSICPTTVQFPYTVTAEDWYVKLEHICASLLSSSNSVSLHHVWWARKTPGRIQNFKYSKIQSRIQKFPKKDCWKEKNWSFPQ